jgi:hypothetical protein
MQRKLLGIINVDFDVTGQLLIIYSAFVKYLRKYGNTMRQCISYLQTSRKPMTLFKKQDGEAWAGLISLRIGTGGRLL